MLFPKINNVLEWDNLHIIENNGLNDIYVFVRRVFISFNSKSRNHKNEEARSNYLLLASS